MRSLALFISALSLPLASACSAGAEGLDAIHADIISDYAAVAQLSPDAFLALDPADVLLLDIREPEEFAVSRIPGAIWVNPSASAETALIQIGNVTGKKIVVYCSVGVRSSRFAQRTQTDLLDMGAVSVANLEQGIFGWHNDQRALVDATGETDVVHPYDAIWKRYVDRKDRAVFTPMSRDEASSPSK